MHTLGAFPTRQNLQAAFRAFDRDPDKWVRFGATRSLVEMAARSESPLRSAIFAGFQKRTHKLLQEKESIREFENAIIISKVARRREWCRLVAMIVDRMHELSATPESTDRIERLMQRLKETYAS